jgi:hypothetical protein
MAEDESNIGQKIRQILFYSSQVLDVCGEDSKWRVRVSQIHRSCQDYLRLRCPRTKLVAVELEYLLGLFFFNKYESQQLLENSIPRRIYMKFA